MPKKPNGELDGQTNQPRSLGHRVLSSIVWMLSASGLQALLRVVILALLARLLTPEDFGLANAGLTVVSFAAIFSQLGMDRALIQRSEVTDAHLRTASTIFSLSGIVAGVGVAALAPQIARFFQTDEVIPVVRAVACIFPLQALIIVPMALMQRELRFRRLGKLGVFSYLGGYGVIGISLAMAGFGVWALIAAAIGQGLIFAVWVLKVQPFPKRPQLNGQAFRDLIYFGGGHTTARLLNQVGGQADNLIVGRWLGVEALGIYGRAYQMLVFPVNLFSSALSTVLFPSFAKLQDDRPRLVRAYRQATALTALVYLPLTCGLIILAPELVRVLLGENWVEVVLPFQILAAGLLFRANKVNLAVAQAMGAVYRRAWREGIYGGMVASGVFIGLRWGLPGVAMGVLVALVANFVLMSQLTLSVTGVSWRRYAKVHLPALRLAVVALAIAWLVTGMMRSLAAPAILTLLAAGIATGAVLLLLIYLLPQQFVGKEGLGMLDTVLDYLPKRISGSLAWLRPSPRGDATY